MHAAHGCSDQPVAFFSVHVVVSARQLTAAQAGPKSQHALSQVKREKPAPSAAMSPGTQSDCGYVTQFGSVDGDTDGEALRDSVCEPDIDDDDERVWLADPVVEHVTERGTLAEAVKEPLSVDERVSEPVLEAARLGLAVELAGRLKLAETLGVVDGVRLALGSH